MEKSELIKQQLRKRWSRWVLLKGYITNIKPLVLLVICL
jgi:hypothetical protein